MKVSTLTFTWSMSQDARDTPSQINGEEDEGGFFLFVILRQGF